MKYATHTLMLAASAALLLSSPVAQAASESTYRFSTFNEGLKLPKEFIL